MSTISPTANGSATTSTSQTGTSALGKLNENFDAFLTLLTQQLKNQDPLDPVDTAEFTQQLVQFSSVEQLIQQSELTKQLLASQQQQQNLTAAGLVGRYAEVPGPVATLQGGLAQWTYTLPDGVSSVTLEVLDADGTVVNTISGATAKGPHEVLWDGSKASGGTATDGNYRLRVNALDNDGKPVVPQLNGYARVDRITYDDKGAYALVNNTKVPVSQITGVA